MKYTEIDQNRIIILQKTYNPGALHQTDGRTEIHTFFIWYPRVGREHNSPSGNKFAPQARKFLIFGTETLILQWENEQKRAAGARKN